MGGTSGGAAMTAAFVRGVGPDEIERAVHDIFVRRRAMRRWTWPRYSLLDPSVLDACLEQHFTSLDIEDLPLPYFAVATNLTRNEPVCIRSGPLWHAVRASSAIPALLPPVISRDGDMLVDGCLLENVPVKPCTPSSQGRTSWSTSRCRRWNAARIPCRHCRGLRSSGAA